MTRSPDASPRPDRQEPPARLARRGVLIVGGALLAAGLIGAGQWYRLRASVGDGTLTTLEAAAAVAAGEITLVDIRRPDEWAVTGVPQGSVPLDMRRDDFPEALSEAMGGRKDRPVALICARGVRSRRLSARLIEAGFTQVLDVSEGMLGSRAGPGWVARGLPVTRP